MKNTIFGLDKRLDQSDIIVVPVPWEGTVSYRRGTSQGPEKILEASEQIDYFHPDFEQFYEQGIFMLDISDLWKEKSIEVSTALDSYRQSGYKDHSLLFPVNDVCVDLQEWIESQILSVIQLGKKCVVLGGEHSVSYGALRAYTQVYDSFGVLQIDAHADLRESYEGVRFSHASVMREALGLAQIEKLVQVGVRDCCEEEMAYIGSNRDRISSFTDWDLKQSMFKGHSWEYLCQQIISECPEQVYISFDIDGLSPACCPNTGTPVPGGLSFEQVFYLIKLLVDSGRQIIGYDLVEVAGKSHDINIITGMRALYYGCGYMSRSHANCDL